MTRLKMTTGTVERGNIDHFFEENQKLKLLKVIFFQFKKNERMSKLGYYRWHN